MIIGNIGLGLFILIIVWIAALIVFVVGIKFQNNIAWISLATATVFTVVLLLIPLDNPNKFQPESDPLDEDYEFIYKVVLLSFLTLSALLGFVFFFVLYCIEPIQPKRSKNCSISK